MMPAGADCAGAQATLSGQSAELRHRVQSVRAPQAKQHDPFTLEGSFRQRMKPLADSAATQYWNPGQSSGPSHSLNLGITESQLAVDSAKPAGSTEGLGTHICMPVSPRRQLMQAWPTEQRIRGEHGKPSSVGSHSCAAPPAPAATSFPAVPACASAPAVACPPLPATELTPPAPLAVTGVEPPAVVVDLPALESGLEPASPVPPAPGCDTFFSLEPPQLQIKAGASSNNAAARFPRR